MSAAASLDALRDIHLPPAPGLWPPAPGWWVVAFAVVLLALLWWGRRHGRRRPLRAALREIDHLAAAFARDADAAALARGLSRLLRRYALWRFPQAPVARLAGAEWLRFLDAHGGGGAFCNGAGAVLETLPYRPHGDADGAELVALACRWLRANAP